MENVVILLRNQPTPEELESLGLGPRQTLLGLYVRPPADQPEAGTARPCPTGS